MPLTTVHEGRVYDWSHAVGRNAARGPGFNYIQTMCLGKNGVLYATNRGNENNFGMHVNKVQLGGPGEEEHIADFCEYGEGDGQVHLAVRGCRRRQRPCLRARTTGRTRSPCSTAAANSSRKWGTTGSGDGELHAPGRSGCREERQHHRRRQRQQPPPGLHSGRQVRRQVRRPRQRGWSVQPALGHHARQGRQHLRRRLEEPPRPEAVPRGQVPDEVRPVRQGRGARGRLCRDHVRAVRRADSRRPPVIRSRARSIIRPTLPSTPMATSTSPIGATIGSASSIPREGRSAI